MEIYMKVTSEDFWADLCKSGRQPVVKFDQNHRQLIILNLAFLQVDEQSTGYLLCTQK